MNFYFNNLLFILTTVVVEKKEFSAWKVVCKPFHYNENQPNLTQLLLTTQQKKDNYPFKGCFCSLTNQKKTFYIAVVVHFYFYSSLMCLLMFIYIAIGNN